MIFDRNLISNELVRTCWASSIAYASNVQGRLQSLQVWITRICKPRHPLINAMLRRYRFLNRNLFYFDVLVGYRCFFFCGYRFLNKLLHFRKHLQSIMSPKSTVFMPYCNIVGHSYGTKGLFYAFQITNMLFEIPLCFLVMHQGHVTCLSLPCFRAKWGSSVCSAWPACNNGKQRSYLRCLR